MPTIFTVAFVVIGTARTIARITGITGARKAPGIIRATRIGVTIMPAPLTGAFVQV